jgi:hypothetical protein
MYDFNEQLKFLTAHFWNYNVLNNTGLGAKNVIIDYSTDGTNWTELGQYIWNEATGDPAFKGDSIPDLTNVLARYLLITIVDNWDNTGCAGFSEIIFTVEHCPGAGTACDDDNPLTLDDMYDKDCNCGGLPLPVNDCDPTVLILPQEDISTGLYDAADSVVSQSMINLGSSVTMVAGQGIILEAGFEVEEGAVFYATPFPCDTSGESLPFEYDKNEFVNLWVTPNPAKDWVQITFTLPQTSKTNVTLRSIDGKTIFKLVSDQVYDPGIYAKKMPVHTMPPGLYTVEVEHDMGVKTERLTIIKSSR